MTVTYTVKDGVYINLTNRCSNSCGFCIRNNGDGPDPVLFESHEAWQAASANAHYIWYYFAAIGLIAAFALLLFAKITQSIDKKKQA